jgi:hypothetical protein
LEYFEGKPDEIMKKWDLKKIKLAQADIHNIDDKTLLLNLYATQLLTLIVALIVILFQHNPLADMFRIADPLTPVLWGLGFAVAVIVFDLAISKWVPEHVTDDGGINERLFGNRPLWHVAVMSAIVAICEELLFRGAIQHALDKHSLRGHPHPLSAALAYDRPCVLYQLRIGLDLFADRHHLDADCRPFYYRFRHGLHIEVYEKS